MTDKCTVVARYESFILPPTLFATEGGEQPIQVYQLQEKLDGSNYVTEQYFADSADDSAPVLLGA